MRFSISKLKLEELTGSSIDGDGSSEPTISSASSAAVTSSAFILATVFPDRRTVMVSAISRTSFNL